MESDDSHLQALELNAVVLACLSGLFGENIIGMDGGALGTVLITHLLQGST